MKSFFKSAVLSILLTVGIVFNAQSQSVKLFLYDGINGAANGLALGGATMALQNSNDWAPARVGLGVGILYGVGVGIYDNSIVPKGQQFYISGKFNDGKNSTVIVLLDTFYGAASGAALGSAFSLIGNEPILDGIQYGSGAGAWIGFGFGLIDSFVLAEGPDDLSASLHSHDNGAKGIVRYTPPVDNLSVGFINPSIVKQKVLGSNTLHNKYSMAMEVVNMKLTF